ncbi:MAG: cytochrome c biogenesis protein CcdA [Acidimicrobiia bacterium]|nr:cytochrome c biogenesis protein CcdA [Acidimicrobiia bacterium]
MEYVALPVIAIVAGMVSFSSPCALPLVPSYLSYVSALPVSELGRAEARSTTLRAALLFVCGFTIVFTLLGVSVGLLGSALNRNLPLILKISGIIIIVMGLGMLGFVRIPIFTRERRLDLARVPSGPKAALPLGMAFAFGWTPCIGPVLATILATASATQTAAWGGLLLALFSIGLGLPFVLLALGYDHARGSLGWLRRHGRTVERLGGAMLVVVGVLFVTDVWNSFFLPLQRNFARLGWPPI